MHTFLKRACEFAVYAPDAADDHHLELANRFSSCRAVVDALRSAVARGAIVLLHARRDGPAEAIAEY